MATTLPILPSKTCFMVSRRGPSYRQQKPLTSDRFLALASLHGLDELAQAGAVDGHRLLDERVDALLDRVGQVDRPEVRGRGQEHHVDLVDHLLVGVEARVLAVPGDVDPGAYGEALELGQAVLEPILEGVGHGDQPRAAVGRERLLGRAGAAAAAADQPDLDRAAARGVHHGHDQPVEATAAPAMAEVFRKSRRLDAGEEERKPSSAGSRGRSVSHGVISFSSLENQSESQDRPCSTFRVARFGRKAKPGMNQSAKGISVR